MASLRDLYEHTPDPRIDKVRGYYDKASRMAEALYRGFLGSIPQPEGGPVYVDDQGVWSGGQLPEQQAYNTLSWLVPTGGVGEAVDFARNGFRPGTLKAITAYHGSPHKFDKFDMSKIGTGEGAQAYGHGLYFAESPDVAKSYQNTLTATRNPSADGVALHEWAQSDPQTAFWISDEIQKAGQMAGQNIDSSQALNMVLNRLAGGKFGTAHPAHDRANYALDEIEQHIPEEVKKVVRDKFAVPEGNLYKTSLEWPDPAREAADPLGPQHFLDWDRPLSENMGSVKNALSDEHLYNLGIDSAGNDAYTGKALSVADFANFMKNQYGDNGSAKLAASGIPGIRYLDQGSRGAGGGTYNYVVFDDKIPKIVERNGVTLDDLLRR